MSPTSAQFVVHDLATTARNRVTAILKEYLYQTQIQQRLKIREMARRLSALTCLRKYSLEDVPRWRTHGGDFFYAQPHNDALICGDPSGAAFVDLIQPLAPAVPIAAGVVVLLAGALQFNAWKARHLACCREALGRGITLPADARTAWRHGLRLVAAAITAERLAPAGARVARAIGAVVIGAGLLLIARAGGL